MIGVVLMNYHGYLIVLGGPTGDSFVDHVFDPWMGPLSTRFAATFVVIAGMGITLMTNRGRLSGDRYRQSADRWTLFRRGFLLYCFGFFFEWIWNGTILFFYGAYFMVGAAVVPAAHAVAGADRSPGRNCCGSDPVVGVRGRPQHLVAVGGLVHPAPVPLATPIVVRHVRQWHAPASPLVGVRLCRNGDRSLPAPTSRPPSGTRGDRRRIRRRNLLGQVSVRRHTTRAPDCWQPTPSAAASTTRCAHSGRQ